MKALESFHASIASPHGDERRFVPALLAARTAPMARGENVDGHDAVDRAKALNSHLVLIDVSKPRMVKVQAARIIQEQARSEVIIVSRNDLATICRHALKTYSCAYVAGANPAKLSSPAVDKVVRWHELQKSQ